MGDVYVTILVLVIALLGGAVGFVAAWMIQSRAMQQLRRETSDEIAIWRETCAEIEQEAAGFRDHAESLERRLGSAHNVGRDRVVAMEAEIASIRQSKADLLAAVEAEVSAAKLRYENRISELEEALNSGSGAESRRESAPRSAENPGQRPDGLGAPLGPADDLKKINGVGPKLEQTLNELGIYHYRQIAGLTEENVLWIDTYLKFKGRIDRDNWIGQAQVLTGDTKVPPAYREESETEDVPPDLGRST